VVKTVVVRKTRARIRADSMRFLVQPDRPRGLPSYCHLDSFEFNSRMELAARERCNFQKDVDFRLRLHPFSGRLAEAALPASRREPGLDGQGQRHARPQEQTPDIRAHPPSRFQTFT